MKMRTKKVVAGLLVAASLATGAMATNGFTTSITVFKGGINVVKDGQLLTMKDVNGTIVDPMIYQGTTYLPVRAIAEANGLDVDWDGSTRTVLLGGKDVTYLDELAPLYFDTNEAESKYSATSDIKYGDKTYKSGIKFVLDTDTSEGVDSVLTLTYALNGNYKKFLTKLACTYDEYGNTFGTEVKITGDGRELYRSPLMTEDSRAFDLDLDVSGVQTMEINFTTKNSPDSNMNYFIERHFHFLDARLLK